MWICSHFLFKVEEDSDEEDEDDIGEEQNSELAVYASKNGAAVDGNQISSAPVKVDHAVRQRFLGVLVMKCTFFFLLPP